MKHLITLGKRKIIKWKCFFGFHDWSDYKYTPIVAVGSRVEAYCYLKRCKKCYDYKRKPQ